MQFDNGVTLEYYSNNLHAMSPTSLPPILSPYQADNAPSWSPSLGSEITGCRRRIDPRGHPKHGGGRASSS